MALVAWKAGEHARHRTAIFSRNPCSAVEMLRKLSGSERVEQVFVRHAFRYWMGRNETLGDGPSLQQAHKAYRESGGSMKTLISALIASDSFLYRVPTAEPKVESKK